MARKKVAIIGAGRFGNSLARLFRRSGVAVALWDTDAYKVPGRKPLPAVLRSADAVFFCIPSFALNTAMKECKKYLQKDCVVVSPIKGIDRKTGSTTVDILTRHLPGHPHAILGGPMLAEELDRGLGGTAVIASRHHKAARRLGALFAGSKVNVVYSTDMRGVALLGVMKNVYAVAMGVAEGLGWGMNYKGPLIAQATAEMRAILAAAGGKPDTAAGVAGLGDLVATGFSHYSRNHNFGVALAQGKRPTFESEGRLSIRALLALLKKKRMPLADLPLLAATARAITKKGATRKAFKRFQANGGA